MLKKDAYLEAERRIEKAKELRRKTQAELLKRFILDTPVEIFACAAVAAVAGGYLSYDNEAEKRGQIPLAYSEIDDIGRNFRIAGEKVPSLTAYYGALNNAVMTIFEANNRAYVIGDGSDKDFAIALDDILRDHGHPYAELPEIAEAMSSYARDALETVEPLDEAHDDVTPIINALDDAWYDSHIDHYTTEYYWDTECDSDGTNCRSVQKSREVYDYTVHTYRYYEQHGDLAADLLRDFRINHPDIRIDEQLLLAERTYDENKQIMLDSRKNMPDFEGLDEADYLSLANTWATGSNYNSLVPGTYKLHSALLQMGSQWERASLTAESYRYITYSSYDSGPEEFQIAEAALDYAVDMAKRMERVTGGMEAAAEGLPKLDRMVYDYVNAMVYNEGQSDVDTDDMRDEIMDTARDLYKQNFAGGFDVHPFKWGRVVLLTVLSVLAGAGIGFGVDRGLNAIYSERSSQPTGLRKYMK